MVSPSVGYRQLSIIFNPWKTGKTTVSAVTVDYLGSRRVVHRIGSLHLALGRQDLAGLSGPEVVTLLVDTLHTVLSSQAATIPRPLAPAPLEGVTGSSLWGPWEQQSLNLDLRD